MQVQECTSTLPAGWITQLRWHGYGNSCHAPCNEGIFTSMQMVHTHTHTHTWKHPEGRRWNEIKWTMSYNLMKFTGAIPNFKPTTNHKLNMTWQWTKSKYKAVLLLAACHTHALNANWKKKQSSPWSIGGHKLNGLSVLNPYHCATDASSLDGDMWSTLHPTPSPSSQNSVLCTCMEPFIAGL